MIQFVMKPAPSIEAKVNTSITLFWQIRYESCSQVTPNCFQENLCITFKDKINECDDIYLRTPGPNDTISGKLLFVVNATKSADITFNYINLSMRIIMLVDEYVHANVASITCYATYSLNGTSDGIDDTVSLIQTSESPTMCTTVTSSPPTTSESATQLPCTCAPVKAFVSNSALVVCSPILIILLGFFLLLQLHPFVSYC